MNTQNSTDRVERQRHVGADFVLELRAVVDQRHFDFLRLIGNVEEHLPELTLELLLVNLCLDAVLGVRAVGELERLGAYENEGAVACFELAFLG